MKRYMLKGIAIFLTCVILLPNIMATAVNTQESNTLKDETVYGTLNEDGSVSGIYVVNGFQSVNGGMVVDYGDYSSVRNMSTSEQINQVSGRVEVNTQSDKFYYEGTLKTTDLPWKINIGYQLNGQDCTADQIKGATGALKIKIHIDRNEKVNSAFFDNYALQMTVALNTDLCDNILADGATQVVAAGKDQLIFTALPGQGGDYTIAANVHDFEMDGISLNGIRLNLNVDLPDTEGMVDYLQQLEGGIGTFSQGASRLQDGVNSLDSGISGLNSGADKLKAGIDALSSQGGSLVNGSDQIRQAMGQIQEALSKFSIPTEEIQLLVQGSAQAKTGIDGIVSGILSLQGAIQTYRSSLSQAWLDPSQIISQDQAAIAALEAAGYTDIANLMRQNIALIQADKSLIDSSETGINTLATNGSTLKIQYALLNAMIAQMPAMLGEMDQQLTQLKNGIDTLYQSCNQLYGGLKEYTSGLDEIAKGYDALYIGFGSLLQGSAQLQQGTAELAGGAQQMQSETSGMTDQVTGILDSAKGLLGSGDFRPISFVSNNNNQVNSVQFLMTTPAIQKEQETKTQDTQEKKLSFWQKILQLFGKKFN